MSDETRQQAIQELAYSKWEQAGRPCGDGVNFWLEAESELCDSIACESESESGAAPKSSIKSDASSAPPPLKVAKVTSGSRRKAG